MNIREIRSQRMKVDLLRERIECIQADIERITQPPRNAPGGGTPSDTLSAKVAKLVDLKTELADEAVALEVGIRAAEGMLLSLLQREQIIVRLRGIEALSWPKVSRRTHYSISQCKRIYNTALQKMNRNEPI